jgi:hypothetical protein
LSKFFAHLIGSGTGCDELLPDYSLVEEAKLFQMIENIKNDPEWMEKSQRAMRIIYG